MAIAPTGAIFKNLIFDGIDLRDYGVYITGEAVFNAPERDVDVITIPGRNGSFVRDNGRFKNITGTYPAGLFGPTEADFSQGISDLRNALCSRKGYKRLSDDYNPNEYREAVYKSGLEVTPSLLKAGEFSITFECKPQRFLASGETAQAVTNGATLTNPTPFDAMPLIEAQGYGTITLPNYQYISVANMPIGFIQPWPTEESREILPSASTVSQAKSFDGSLVALGDELTIERVRFTYQLDVATAVTAMSTSLETGFDYSIANLSSRAWNFEFRQVSLIKGTSSSKTGTVTLAYTIGGTSYNYNATCTLSYDGNQTVTLSMSGGRPIAPRIYPGVVFGILSADSTANATGPIFFDCESGFAWWDESGTIVDANNAASFPDKLPVLSPGANIITFDNTFSSVKVTPRWWKV